MLFSEFLNPCLSLNILAMDDYTDDYFSYLYQFELENDFSLKEIGWGAFIDYFYKENYPFSDPYFIKSGLPVEINVGGGGLQLKYFVMKSIELGAKFGYYAGKIFYPVLGDSGRVIQKSDWRKSFGFSFGVGLLHNFGRIKGGLRFYTNLISFGVKKRPYWYEYYNRSVDYISLNSVGFGLVFGLGRSEEK